MKTISLAAYLFTRLRQHGVGHIHGVPGDYFLKALDYLGPTRLKWIGSCNELNAGYAADGYARIRGLSALFTTYGVGELSAINAIAGSYAEHVPVVHIVGTPARHLQTSRAMCHHYLGDGSPRVFAEMSKKITVAQANLVDAKEAPEIIDGTIQQCLVQSRPVYIEVPADMASVTISAERLVEPLISTMMTEEEFENAKVEMLLQKIYSSKQPLLLVDRGGGMHHISEEIQELVRISGIPTLVMPSGQGMIEIPTPNYYGVHSGPVGYIDTMPYLNSSDLVLAFGPMFSDVQTLAWHTVPSPTITTTIRKNSISTPTSTHAINAKSFMRRLLSALDTSKLPRPDTASLGDFRQRPAQPKPDPNAPITQDGLYDRLNTYLRPHDIVLLANGTPLLGVRDLLLPPNTTVIASGLWYAIGSMLPAAQGAALAQQDPLGSASTQFSSPLFPPSSPSQNPSPPNRRTPRTILLEGDGSFQVSAQELSTILKLKLDVTIFIINNEGYAYERLIHGLHADYNDVAPWRYAELAGALGAPQLSHRNGIQSGLEEDRAGRDTEVLKTGGDRDDGNGDDAFTVSSHRVNTWAELDVLLEDEEWVESRGVKVVDIVVGREDVPGKFKGYFEGPGKG
jgi:pyruvate decarboxylase